MREELFHGDGFGEVAGHVYVAAFVDGYVVGKQLQGDGGDDRRDAIGDVGNLDDVVGKTRYHLVTFRDDRHDCASARLDLLHVAHYLVVEVVFGCDYDARHPLVDERDRSVLHLRCRISLGMNIAYLLEFQRALQGGGIVVAPAEVEEIVGECEDPRDLLHLSVKLQCLGDYIWQSGDGRRYLSLLCGGKGSAEPSDRDCKHSEHRHLSGEGLSGGDPYFGTDVDVGTGVGLSRYGGTDHVAYAVDERSFLMGAFDSREGVGSLTALGDGDDNIIGSKERLAVAELAGVFDRDWDVGEFLEQALTDEGGMPGGAARHYHEPVDS